MTSPLLYQPGPLELGLYCATTRHWRTVLRIQSRFLQAFQVRRSYRPALDPQGRCKAKLRLPTGTCRT